MNRHQYFVDLNESGYQSRWRLFSMFHFIADEQNLSKAKIKRAAKKLDDIEDIDTFVTIMDEYLGDSIVFYYGVGDNDSADKNKKQPTKASTPTTTTKKTKKTTKKGSTQDNLLNNLEKHAKK